MLRSGNHTHLATRWAADAMMSAFRWRSWPQEGLLMLMMWVITPIWPREGLLMLILSAFRLGSRTHLATRGAADAHDAGVQVEELTTRRAADAYDVG